MLRRRLQLLATRSGRFAVRIGQRALRHPVLTSITPIGWTIIGGGVVGGWIGWRQSWLEFRALGVMALVVLLVATPFVLRRREHHAELELHRPRVQAGDQVLGRVLITSAGGTAPAAAIELPVGKAVAAFRVGALRPGDEHEEMFSIPTRRRGIITLGPVRSVQSDPIGVVSRQRILTDASELYIHPKIVHVSLTAIGVLKDIEGITTANLSSSDVAFHALRDYVPGDDRRSVHWRTTARTGRLMVRQFEETMRAHLLVLLSTMTSDYDSDDDFELAVSTVGSMAVSALRDGRQVTVRTSTQELRFPHALGLLDKLSGVELTSKGVSLRGLAANAGGIPGVSVAALVAGTTAPSALRAAQLALPPGVYPYAVRCHADGAVARRKVGELTVLDVTQLGDLPVALGSLR